LSYLLTCGRLGVSRTSTPLPPLGHADENLLGSIDTEEVDFWEEETEPSSSDNFPGWNLNPPIENNSSASVTSPEDSSNRSDLVFDAWYSDNDTNPEYTQDPILASHQPIITDRKGGSDGEYQYSESGGSPWWTLGTNTLMFSLVALASHEQDVLMEEDDQQDDRNDHKDLPMFWPPDEPRVDAEEDIDDKLDTYHPIVVAYFLKMSDLDVVLERLDELDDEKTELQREKETRQRFGLDLDPDDEAWLLECDVLQHDLDEKRNAYEAQAALLKQECLLGGWVDDEGEPLLAALGRKIEDTPTPNSKDLEKPLSQLMLILAVLQS
jgi:hypothetical protein